MGAGGAGYNIQDQEGGNASSFMGNVSGLASLGGMVGGPVGMAVGAAAGLGLSIFGGMQQYSSAKKQFGVQQNIFGLEQQAEAQRKQMMELNANRMSMEVVRNQQRARSLALSNSTSQGAQFGSGLQGGYGQISGQSGVGLLGISQQLGAGENLFGINKDIMGQRQQYSNLGSQAYTGSMISNLGGTIGGLSRSFGKDLLYSG